MKSNILIFFICLLPLSLAAQLKPIGSWTEHLPFQKGTSIVLNGQTLYCGTTTGLFTINLGDNSISRYSTVNRLNDINIKKLAYSKQDQALLVIYDNLNIDVLKGGQTINIPSIKDASITNKEINKVFIKGSSAYLSAGFGVVKLNIARNEISETYQFAPGGGAINVNSTFVDDTKIYAATNDGLYVGNLSSNLLDFNSWSVYNTAKKKDIIDLFEYAGNIYIVSNESNNDSIFKLENNSITAINQLSAGNYLDHSVNGDKLLTAKSTGISIYDINLQLLSQFSPIVSNLSDITFSSDRVFLLNTFDPLIVFDYQGNSLGVRRPSGPFEENIFDLEFNDGTLWAVPGGYDQSINNLYRGARLYRYKDNVWTNYIDFNIPSFNGVYDALSVNTNPDNPEEVYLGCWGTGLVELKNSPPFQIYNELNSVLKDRKLRPGWVAVGGTAFDENGNLWIVNSYTSSILSVKQRNGNWAQFTIGNLESGDETAATEIVISNAAYKWVALPFDNHILVYDDNNTITNPSDDREILLKQGEGAGDIPGIRGITMAIDLENQLWIGTSDGLAVNYNPDNIFETATNDRDFERILIDDGENIEILLAGTEIKDIEIDGANRKWIATAGSGVYLLSPDGKDEINHFTTENSPLFSNNVLSLAIDAENGEVFMATANGLISYRSEVVSGNENLSEISVFPNPVRDDYQGQIAIDGLMDKTTVKITDIEGRLVNEFESKGGRALWNGQNLLGERVPTGVYLVFASGLNEKESLRTAIAKILFIH